MRSSFHEEHSVLVFLLIKQNLLIREQENIISILYYNDILNDTILLYHNKQDTICKKKEKK